MERGITDLAPRWDDVDRGVDDWQIGNHALSIRVFWVAAAWWLVVHTDVRGLYPHQISSSAVLDISWSQPPRWTYAIVIFYHPEGLQSRNDSSTVLAISSSIRSVRLAHIYFRLASWFPPIQDPIRMKGTESSEFQ